MPGDETGYNGWRNYESWLVNRWIDNDEYLYSYRQGLAQDTWDEAKTTEYSTREQSATHTLADALEEWVAEEVAVPPDALVRTWSGLVNDLLSAALSEVDWYEIAEHALAEVDKSGEDEDVEVGDDPV